MNNNSYNNYNYGGNQPPQPWGPQQPRNPQPPQPWNGPQQPWNGQPPAQPWSPQPPVQPPRQKSMKPLVIILSSVLGVLVIALVVTILVLTGTIGGSGGNSGGSVSYAAGDTLYFGSYQGEAIEWRVLETDGSDILVISEYAVDLQPYNTARESVTWEESTLRTWLNDDFYNAAFSRQEQAAIQKTDVTADANAYYDLDPGNDTKDRIFLLSLSEAEQYNDYDCRLCVPTAYTASLGAHTETGFRSDGEDTCWWWLRSRGAESDCAACVRSDGTTYYIGNYVDTTEFGGVRPVMWLDSGKIDAEAAAGSTAGDAAAQPADDTAAADAGTVPQDDSGAADGDADAQAADTDAAPTAAVGDTLTFGNYGGEDIEWRVLAVDGDKVMLISKYGLKLFPEENLMLADYSYDTWENCDLRTWLNGDFYDTAFTDEEKNSILTTTVENPDTFYGQDAAGNYVKNNTGDGISDMQDRVSGGNTTEDKVFLLSLDEAQTLFDYTETTLQTSLGDTYTGCADLQCSAIASVSGGSTNEYYVTAEGEGCVWWWLRSTGGNPGLNCVVGMDGICQYYYDWHYVNPVVRPVMWIELSGAQSVSNDDAEGDTSDNGDNSGQTESEDTIPLLVFNGHSYEAVFPALTFTEAEAYCEQNGGHLATIESAEENEAITDYICEYYPGDSFMIGLYDADGSNGTWSTWVTGTPVTYQNWGAGQPDFSGQTICVINSTANSTYDWEVGEWDNGYDGDYAFLLERDTAE